MYERRDKWLGKSGRIRRRGIYWLPNLFTTVALFAGFFSIVQAMNGHFDQSALAIFVALVFDGLDGRVARFTHTQSAFGAEYDSLSDMVSFGVAPALVMYEWALRDFSAAQNIPLLGPWVTTKLGWIAAFIYCACAAFRLARFNTQLEVADKRFFQGLPSPAAACLVAGLVWAMSERQIQRQIAEMEGAGLITRIGRTSAGKGKTSNEYDLTGLVKKMRELEEKRNAASKQTPAPSTPAPSQPRPPRRCSLRP